MMFARALGSALAVFAVTLSAARADDAIRITTSPAAIAEANFLLLTALDADPAARSAMAEASGLADVAAAVRARTAAAAQACEDRIAQVMATGDRTIGAGACTVEAVRWTPEETAAAEAAAVAVYDASPAVRALVAETLRPSGRFALYEERADRDLFRAAWTEAHAGIDRIIRVYGLNEAPQYADIDSVIYPFEDRSYQGLLGSLVRETARAITADDRAHAAPLHLAMELMIANRRDDAVRLAALERAENAKTAARMAGLDWSAFPYPVILVPGNSPSLAEEPLNPNAKLRMRRGVERWRAGEAPVIVVSGGTLRPLGTVHNEALEMKRHLMAVEGVPEDAILIEPVARHTTTNMRNTVRLMVKYGAPTDRPSLVVGNSVPYIASERFLQRCRDDFGYVPFTPGARLEFEALAFTPSLLSLHVDPEDPMDP